jgi:hypothetical protein
MNWKILLAALALLAAEPALAAPAGSNQPEDLRRMHDLAQCIVRNNAPEARRILELDHGTSAYDRQIRRSVTSVRPCVRFSGSLRMAHVLLSGAFAEALLPGALKGQTLASRAAYDPSKPAIPARNEGEYLGLCAVRSMPAEVAALLATEPGSDAEKQALTPIVPGLAPCVKEGAAATLNRPGLRALLALAAHRIVTQQAPAGRRASGS